MDLLSLVLVGRKKLGGNVILQQSTTPTGTANNVRVVDRTDQKGNKNNWSVVYDRSIISMGDRKQQGQDDIRVDRTGHMGIKTRGL